MGSQQTAENLRCPLAHIPDFIHHILIKFRFMADEKDTSAVFLQSFLDHLLHPHPDGWSAHPRRRILVPVHQAYTDAPSPALHRLRRAPGFRYAWS